MCTVVIYLNLSGSVRRGAQQKSSIGTSKLGADVSSHFFSVTANDESSTCSGTANDEFVGETRDSAKLKTANVPPMHYIRRWEGPLGRNIPKRYPTLTVRSKLHSHHTLAVVYSY